MNEYNAHERFEKNNEINRKSMSDRFMKNNYQEKTDNVVNERIAENSNSNIRSKKLLTKVGVVTNCLRLCLREEPNIQGKVLKYLEALSEVTIDVDNSTDDFYKVKSDDNVEGYCMKNYVTIKG